MASLTSSRESKGGFDPECMDNCTSKQHGREICDLGTGIKTHAVVPMWMKTCANYAHVRDKNGRTALHIVASTGNEEAVGWLIKRAGCDIDKKDKISGYTALHRSIFFGQVHIARSLIAYNADVNLKDHEGMTPLELCHADRPKPFSFSCLSDPSELFVWGTNDNYTLGTAIQQTRPVPEQLEIFKKTGKSIQQVAMSTYHSVFLAQTGEVYTCGSGRGGKLGLGHESSVLKPEIVQLNSKYKCIKISAGVDQTLFLSDNGKVLSCGSNENGVLGQKSSVTSCLVPKPVELPKSTSIKGLAAARYHSVFYTSKCIYTCGANRGQLGHSVDVGSIVYEPKVISQHILDSNGDLKFTHVTCNDFTTVARVSSGIVYILHKSESLKINTKQFDVEKLEITGGSWADSISTDKPGRLKEEGGSDCPISLFILTTTGRIVIWRESGAIGGCFNRVVFNTGRIVLDIKDFCVSSTCIGFVTKSGEAYRCSWKPNYTPITIVSIQQRSQANSLPNQNDFQVSSGSRRQQKGKDYGQFTVGLEHIKTTRIKNIYSAGSITCDPRGNNFAIIQAIPKKDLTLLPDLLESEINNDMRKFLEEAHPEDALHDVLFKVGTKTFPSHRYVIASGCPKLYSMILNGEKSAGHIKPITVCIENMKPNVFQQLLQYIYSNSCDLISPGKCFSESEDFIRQCIESARRLDLELLCKELKKVEIVEDLVRMKRGETLRRPSPKRYNRKGFPELFDVTLKNQNGDSIRAHRCVLIARMEYFHSMLYANSWIEHDQDKPVHLQLPKGALQTLLDFIYSDEAPNLPINDFDGLSDVLVMSDTFFIERLRSITENALADKLCFKNISSLLYLACMCNAAQLRDSCMEFITQNLSCILENRILDPLPSEILKSISVYYCETHPAMFGRQMKRTDAIPKDVEFLDQFGELSEDLKNEFSQCLQDEEIRKPQVKSSKSRLRMRSRASESELDLTPKSPSLLNLNVSIDSTTDLIDEEQKCNSFHSDLKDENPDLYPYSCSPPVNNVRMKINIPNPMQTMQNLKNAEIKEQTPVKKMLNPLEFPTLSTNKVNEKAPVPIKSQNQEKPMSANSKVPNANPGPNKNKKVTVAPEPSLKINPASGGSAKKKVKWKAVNIENIAAAITESVPSPTSAISPDTKLSRDPSNPWKIKSTEKVVFTEIVQDEVEKKENLAKAVTKSINLMQIEERAMNELTALYTSRDVQEGIEILTVERIFSNNFAHPTWVQHQHAAAMAQSQSQWPKFAQ